MFVLSLGPIYSLCIEASGGGGGGGDGWMH